MYTDRNYKTKKQVKQAVANGERVTVHQPGGMFPSQRDGIATIEGPHYPQPHKWYAQVTIKDGVIIKIK